MAIDWEKTERKWQKAWEKAGLGKAKVHKNKEKFMMIFAYPGISGYLHVGHMRGFSYTDAICRYERLQGKEVLFPVGTHASGNQAIAFGNKVKNKDADWMAYLRNNGCSEEKILELESADKVIAYFNEVYLKEYWQKFGFLCDWERFTCTTYPDYGKFIDWQFRKLMQKNLLVQKPYFATACVKCGPVAVDPSETDLSKGGNAEKQEFTLLKFKCGEDYLIAATLRPETVFGQTNLWINPQAEYVRVDVAGEKWIVSREAAEKLSYQKENLVVGETIKAAEWIGRQVLAPGIGREIPVYPASFCDPKFGTGIVTSVPSDAPYDYVALKVLQENTTELEKYGLKPEAVKALQLIPIILTKGYGDYPAKEIVENMGITSLDNPKLEEATKEIYKAGYHTGVMMQNCGKYAGKKVEEAKELMKAELLEKKEADILHDLSEEVICRCGNKVIVKKIDDQWFIRYSNQELTERSKEQAKEMRIFPEEYYENMPGVLEWFNDRACARLGNWLGSKFPFDNKWTIEPISDSTLYPAYYIVSKFINNKYLTKEELTEEFFDYVFLGKGAGVEKWKAVKEEFDYFYPLDMNLGGKEHKTVHFPVFLMNHVAILPEEKWPRGIFVNWWVTGKGSKISKSKGGAEPIPQAVQKYGVDAMRLYYAHIGSPHVDVVWEEEVVFNYKSALERILLLVEEIKELKGKNSLIDDWLLSRVHRHLNSISEAMKKYALRDLASTAYFSFYDDLRWYVRRGGANRKVILEVLDIWCKLLNPITPHLSEELNLGSELVSSSSWPEVNKSLISHKAEAAEELVKDTVEGMRKVLKLAKLEKAQKFTIFIADSWLYELYSLLSKEIKVTRNIGEVMRKVLEQGSEGLKGRDLNKIVPALLKDASKLPEFVISQEEEIQVMVEAKDFLEKEFGCEVLVLSGEGSSEEKAKQARPGKVGVLVE
ncbi:leucine--tRNA ligase [Candidatus Woesearchaeota archaeon]|nr:leucine--tRNA ligase [Candidatus Woesearchaeota archaeon]